MSREDERYFVSPDLERFTCLWDLLITRFPDLMHSVFMYLEFFDRVNFGGTIFSPETELIIAISSLETSDQEIAEQYGCDVDAIRYIRNKLSDIVIYTLVHSGHVIPPYFEKGKYFYRLEGQVNEEFIDVANVMATSEAIHPSIRRFFHSYASTLGVHEAFNSLDIQLTKEQNMLYNRYVRYYLNPELQKVQNFHSLLRRYLFADIIKNPNTVDLITEAIVNLSTLDLHYLEARYEYIRRVGHLAKEMNLEREIFRLASILSLGGKPRGIGKDHSALATIIYKLYLTNYQSGTPIAATILDPNTLETLASLHPYSLKPASEI